MLILGIQSTVHNNQRAHIYGTSPGNQRIESWWCFLRRSRCQFWIDLFETLVNCHAFEVGNVRQTELVRFCFMEVIQQDLNLVQRLWNTHRIRPSAGAVCPAGVPDELYFLPPSPAVNCLVSYGGALPARLSSHLVEAHICEDYTLGQYFMYLCQFHNWNAPGTADEAVQLYYRLLPFIH